jgi:hypothetical protein
MLRNMVEFRVASTIGALPQQQMGSILVKVERRTPVFALDHVRVCIPIERLLLCEKPTIDLDSSWD